MASPDRAPLLPEILTYVSSGRSRAARRLRDRSGKPHLSHSGHSDLAPDPLSYRIAFAVLLALQVGGCVNAAYGLWMYGLPGP